MFSGIVIVLAIVLIPAASVAKKYEVVFRGDDVVHVAINILENDILELSGEGIFRRIAPKVCNAPPCTVKFWLDKALTATNREMSPKQKKAMVAEYLVGEAGLAMIYHYRISTVDEVVAEAVCLKEVFHAYCLGGDTSSLAEPTSSETEGFVERRFYPDATIVVSFKGKIATVTRMYDSMTWLKFKSLQSKISKIYGTPKDLGYFPSYAKTPETKETAISIGKAKACQLWPQDGWKLSLMWFESAAGVFYEHEGLKRAMDAASKDEGF